MVVGQDDAVDQLLIALFTGGHCLLTGVPGLAKTLLVRTLAADPRPELQAHPVHAGPDAGRHHRHRGPRRHRRRPRRCASCAGRSSRTSSSPTRSTARRPRPRPRCSRRCRSTRSPPAAASYALERPFFVLATQNPIELEGTYPLPEAQLDRFMFNIVMDYLPEDDEVKVVTGTTGTGGAKPIAGLQRRRHRGVPAGRAPRRRVGRGRPLRRAARRRARGRRGRTRRTSSRSG